MRIVAISPELSYTGVPMILFRLVRALMAHHEVTVACPHDGPLMKDYAALGIQVTGNVNPPDHDVALCAGILTGGIVRDWAKQIPTVWWIHEPDFGLDFINAGKVPLESFKLADKLVFPTRWQAQNVYARWTRDREVLIVPYGIGLDFTAKPAPFQKRPGEFFLVHTGMICHRKGQELTLKAVQSLRDRGMGDGIRVVFLGHVLEADYYRDLPKPGWAWYAGSVNEDTVSAVLQHCDAFVFPTRDDLITLAILEAMAHGRCVLSSDFGPIPETVRHGHTGLLSPVDDWQVLAGNIEMVRRDPNLLNRLAGAAKEMYESKHSFTQHFNSMRHILESIARRR